MNKTFLLVSALGFIGTLFDQTWDMHVFKAFVQGVWFTLLAISIYKNYTSKEGK